MLKLPTVCGAMKVEFSSTLPAVTAQRSNKNFDENVPTPVPGISRSYFIVRRNHMTAAIQSESLVRIIANLGIKIANTDPR